MEPRNSPIHVSCFSRLPKFPRARIRIARCGLWANDGRGDLISHDNPTFLILDAVLDTSCERYDDAFSTLRDARLDLSVAQCVSSLEKYIPWLRSRCSFPNFRLQNGPSGGRIAGPSSTSRWYSQCGVEDEKDEALRSFGVLRRGEDVTC